MKLTEAEAAEKMCIQDCRHCGCAVCHWAFEMVGARPDDELVDLYPGTGAVTKAWKTWQGLFTLPPDDTGDKR